VKLFNDDNLATANIWAEARGEPFDGKVAIGEVMRARMNKNYFSNGTLADTVFRPYQFSALNNDNPWRWKMFTLDDSDAVVRECFRAWTISETTDLTKGALLYCNPRSAHPIWAKPEKLLAEIASHNFYSA